jgi:hypothetical protein
MNSARSLVIAVGVIVVSGQLLSGQVTSEHDTSPRRVERVGPTRTLFTSGRRTFKSCNGGRRTLVREPRWPIRYDRSSSRSTTTRCIRSSSTTIGTAQKA